MEDFSQLFNNKAQSVFYKSRPEYSQDIVKEMISFWKSFNTDREIEKKLNIVDVGCGTGQLTRELLPYSKLLIGIDSSESQIKEAKAISNVPQNLKFMVRSCYEIPVDDGSLDLITAAQCVHWFDVDRFYTEVDRCLRPGGVLVISIYDKGHFVIDGVDDRNSEINKFICHDIWYDDKYFGLLMTDRLRWAFDCLVGIPFVYPCRGIRNDNLVIQMNFTLARYKEYVMSTSLYQRWKKDHRTQRDIADIIMDKILCYMGNPKSGLDTELIIKYPLTLIMCSKP